MGQISSQTILREWTAHCLTSPDRGVSGVLIVSNFSIHHPLDFYILRCNTSGTVTLTEWEDSSHSTRSDSANLPVCYCKHFSDNAHYSSEDSL